MIAASPQALVETALRWGGDGVVMVTLVGIEGTSSRAIGAQMVVRADGASLGSFSGGCIEAAIIAEALDVLAKGQGRVVRYGIGSPYIDVRLPCGGGIDLLFTPRPDAGALAQAVAQWAARQPAALRLSGDFTLHLAPPPRILAFGQGEDLTAFVRLATAYGVAVEAYSPALSDLTEARVSTHLTSLTQPLTIPGDAWTAQVFLFHDRDWEVALLPKALAAPAYYQGAIGSRRTHEQRLARLAQVGVAPKDLARLRGHIGLIPATRDPAKLALSVLAEVIAAYPG
jgi:xanthine dehydrogenase accessory factor